MFLQQFNQRPVRKKEREKWRLPKKSCFFFFSSLTQVRGKKTLFFSIRQALPFVRVYGGRNSRHKSCCRPRQKTCLNYKVTRKNNQKRWPLLGSFLSLSLGYTRDPRCALLPLSSYKKKRKKKTISNWFSPLKKNFHIFRFILPFETLRHRHTWVRNGQQLN